jgi:enoyl-CoA hydratase/carnithine racemase
MIEENNYSSILFSARDGVATVVLNRPDKLNSFTRSMAAELRHAWTVCRDSVEIRAVVLRAADGRAFCSGVDVTELWPWPQERPFDMDDPGEWLGPKSNKCWKPVVCAIHGIAAGGAFYFINESDIVICSEDAQFFDPHVSFGMVAACEPVGALRMVPYQEVMRMSLMGNDERIGAATAVRISLVTEVLPKEALFKRAQELATKLASKPPAAVQGTVRAIWEAGDFSATTAVRNALKYTQLGNPIGTAEVQRATAPKARWTAR